MHTLDQLRAGALHGAQRLQLRGLTEFPREIFDLADTLEILDLTDNALSSLPDDLPRLHKLRILFCSNNRFTALPAVLGQCAALTMVGFKANQIHTVPAGALPPALRWLILTDNCLESLPEELGRRPALQKLMLAGNRLSALPASMAQLHALELLRISSNALTALPDWLTTLPSLAWLAYAGNPLSSAREALMTAAPAAAIAWPALTLEDQLGEGASGVIYRARWRNDGNDVGNGKGAGNGMGAGDSDDDGSRTEVAVKLFKGAMTSDGLPQSEMAACLHVGPHPNLVAALGRLTDHPDGMQGLVMALIDPRYRNLAGPPDFATCTRDVYATDKRFSWRELLKIAHGIASAAAQLHAHGILHGDLYAHNIVHDADGNSLLGDFGGAAFYDPASPQALPLQRLEVRAYGILLGELLARCSVPADAQDDAAQLGRLRDACLQADHASRPLFAELAAQLHALQGKA